jgi:hypothetical protein
MERESILMYRSTREMLLDMKKENKEQYMTALEMYMDYAFDGTEPELNGQPLVMKLFWKAAKPLIDANNKNYINGCKGGAPTGNQNARKTTQNNPKTTEKQPKNNRPTTQKQGNVNDNDNVNAHVTDNEHDNANANDNVNVNVNNKERCPYVDEKGMITDWDKFQEWKAKRPTAKEY